MKKATIALLAIALALSLAACDSAPKKPALYLEKAQLTKQEESIAKLLGADGDQLIYDFKLDETVESLQITSYELEDGAWRMVSGGGGQSFSDSTGRLALGFEDIAAGLRVALQSEHHSGSTKYAAEPVEKVAGMGRATSIEGGTKEIVYETEIPLVIQISTVQNAVHSYNVDYFFKPEEYAKNGYERVHAITIRFSQKSVSELSEAV